MESHGFVHAYFSPEQEFDLIFGEGAKLSRVRLEPDVLLRVGSSHPVRKPMVELPSRLLGTCRITISCQDGFLLQISYHPGTAIARDAGEPCLHLSRRQRMIRHGAKAARLVDVDFAAVLREGYAD